MPHSEIRSGGLAILVFGVAIVIVLVVGGLVLNSVFYNPVREDAREAAFRGQISGLVAEYCSAPRQTDQEATRQQLISLALKEPTQWNELPTEMKNRAQKVRDNNRQEACK